MTLTTKAFRATVCHRGSEAEDFKKNNPSVTLSRATSLCTKEAEVTLALNRYSAKLMKRLLLEEKLLRSR